LEKGVFFHAYCAVYPPSRITLALHINTGLTTGLTGNEIVEAIMHLVPYTGFPRVLNALEVAKVVFAERGVTVDPA